MITLITMYKMTTFKNMEEIYIYGRGQTEEDKGRIT